ncbi:uncharacterized protein L3040_005338 [Drepanopeziza brunnea f. sp. 'multigermtubi']|uniref:BTB domain-containing protein n=1 Tax=Marssonina brunnea f. sp. multigermtubi (strain MB_m1) TaxID=1072389 RepID=K1WVY1_MARBU|nr:uncharacterized protein MBM_00938 [Drepanopeziza brunnea f. sp. 'multigermtubi' MB_m1]EKD21825.1 hypothetical protein MBM_00938 [Drepanopeziza brunnea f. sp. 'multigermtubi' MB_m1]KAJ5041770.1 hypothetical protein L3040_005338 [Drepanopeziza brunnea f. sp. 'multigermtubi']
MESRTEAKKHYSLEFSFECHGFELPPEIYVNWAADRIYVFGPRVENVQITRRMFCSQSQYFRKLFFEKAHATWLSRSKEERARGNASEISFTDDDSISVWPSPWNTAEAFFVR